MISHTLPVSNILPAAIFIVGALAVPFLKGTLKNAWLLFIPVAGFLNLLMLPAGGAIHAHFMGYELTLLRVDRLSMVFGYIFNIITFLGLLFALSEKRDVDFMAGLLYAGSALGVVFAGDLLSLFCFWEVMTIGSTILIWSRRTPQAVAASLRFAMIHILGGVILLFGIIMHVQETGSIAAGYIGLSSMSTWLIFIGLGINGAWPGIHTWLTDAYPESSIAGAVFLSAFTTKTAVYVLARTFPGAEPLIWIGALMAAFPIFYAVIENDLRRVLSYSLINQVGFMMVGIGIGTELSINGATAHAFNDILFKGLLFMTMGAVMRQTGRINATDLGGLYRTMPLTALFCIVGAASISAFPLFSGFVSKSMVMSASVHEGYTFVWFILLFASAGVFHHAGIKIPFFAFFSHDSGLRPEEPPFTMLLAMGLTAGLCILIGTYPQPLYNILPYPVDYVPYTLPHVTAQLQLLFYSALAFTLLMLSGIYPAELRALNVDADWLYRKGARAFMWLVRKPLLGVFGFFAALIFERIPSALQWYVKNPLAASAILLHRFAAPLASAQKRKEIEKDLRSREALYPGDRIKHWPVGHTVLWVSLFLIAYLVLYYLYPLE